jgi:hypothetical protein
MNRRRRIRHLKRLIAGHKWASIAIGAGVVLIAVAAITWIGSGDSDNPPAASPTSTPAIGNGNDDGKFTEHPKSGTSEVVSAGQNPFGKNAGNPFLPSDNRVGLHTVTVTATSDGAMNIGFRFRGGHGDGKKIAGETFSLTQKVRGGLPIGQIGVQVLYNATYATCSVLVDGVVVASGRTDEGPAHVVVCTG